MLLKETLIRNTFLLLCLVFCGLSVCTMGNENVEIKQNAEKLAEGVAASESSSAQIRFDPEKYPFVVERGVGSGYKFNTTVELYNVTGLFAWQVRVYFNNTLLNATNAYYHPEEPIHNVDHVTVDPIIKNDYNSTHGYIQFGISAIYPDYVNVTAEDYPIGVGICFLEFTVLIKPSDLNDFQCNLVLNNEYTYLLWKDGETEIACMKKNGIYCLISSDIRVPTDYPTIQEAINAADSGDTIFVYNGTYYENVIVNKTLMLFGQSAETVVINGSGGTVILVDSVDDVTIDGFTVISGSYGIYLQYSRCGIISSCNITGNNIAGIYAIASYYGRCSSWAIHGNNISGNGGHGIYVFGRTSYCNSWSIYSIFRIRKKPSMRGSAPKRSANF